MRIIPLLSLILLGSFTFAQQLWFENVSPKITPETLSSQSHIYNQYCRYPVDIRASSSGFAVSSTDAKFFASGFVFTGFQTGTAFPEYFSQQVSSYLPLTGSSLKTQGAFAAGSMYYYINAHVGFGGVPVVLNSGWLARMFFRNNVQITTGQLVWYYINGTGDESSLQSGTLNRWRNVISTVGNTSGWTFVQWPCILDTDAPILTGMQSGQTLNYFTDRFILGIYDWTGSRTIAQTGGIITNSTIHYYFNGGNYIPSTTGIDNQGGIDTACMSLWLSGMIHRGFTGAGVFSGTPLFTGTTFSYGTLSSWLTGYAGEGSGWVWTGQGSSRLRGYFIDRAFSGLSFVDNQQVLAIWSGCDFANQNGQSRTSSTSYTFELTGFDKTPPYIVSAVYRYTAWNGTTDSVTTLTAGEWFSTGFVANFTGWTSGNVDLLNTGNKLFQIDLVSSLIDPSVVSISTPGLGILRTLMFSGNDRGFVLFSDSFGNLGYTYLTGGQPYVYDMKYDMFWIDRTAPSITTGYNVQPGNVRLLLTGANVGNTGATTDDEFIILNFSGVTQPDIQLDIGYSTGTMALNHTGIVFVNDWLGCVNVRDRAGNTVCIDINIQLDTRNMVVKALSAQRAYGNLAWSGLMFFWNTGTFASMNSGNMVNSGVVLINQVGTGMFSGVQLPASGNNYVVLIKSKQHLSAGYTGNTSIRTSTEFDFTTGTYLFNINQFFRTFDTSVLGGWDGVYPGMRLFLIPGDVNGNDVVGSLDLALINSGLTVSLTSPDWWNDFNADGFVTSFDQAILIENSARRGFWAEFVNQSLPSNPDSTSSVYTPWSNRLP